MPRRRGRLQGLGTTSMGVHFDARRHPAQDVARIRRVARRQARYALWRARLRRFFAMRRRALAQARSALLIGLALTGFLLLSRLGGQGLWEEALRATGPPALPSPTASAATAPAANAAIWVWVPQSGSRYHLVATCSGMQAPEEIALAEAEAGGYTPCKRCFPQ